MLFLPSSPPGDVAQSNLFFAESEPGVLPYNPNTWGMLCFDINENGGITGPVIPVPTCDSAECVINNMPEGTRFRALRLPVPDPAMPSTAVQLSDIQAIKTLRMQRGIYPTLWIRFDSQEPLNDLTTYRQLVQFGYLEMLDIPAEIAVDAVVLVTPDILPIQLPALQRRA
jgi:hypothetical protein